MDYFLIFRMIIYTLVVIMLTIHQIKRYFRLQHEKEVFSQGHPICGEVEKIEYHYANKSFASKHYCRAVVVFQWEHSTHRLRVSNSVPHGKYFYGSSINLLFSPLYPKSVIAADEDPTSTAGYWIDSIIILSLVVLYVFSVVNLWPSMFSR